MPCWCWAGTARWARRRRRSRRCGAPACSGSSGISRIMPGHASGPVRMIDASSEDIAEVVKRETGGRGAEYRLQHGGQPVFRGGEPGAGDRRAADFHQHDRAASVPFDIFAFYRAQLTYVGIDLLALDSVASAADVARVGAGVRERGAAAVPGAGFRALLAGPGAGRVSGGAAGIVGAGGAAPVGVGFRLEWLLRGRGRCRRRGRQLGSRCRSPA